MDITLKKRIIGFLLLVGIMLIIIPLFFGRTIPVDELKLSGYVPAPPAKPKDLALPIPPHSATMPVAPKAVKPDVAVTPPPVFQEIKPTPEEKVIPETETAPIPSASPTKASPRTPAIEISDKAAVEDVSSQEAQQISLLHQEDENKHPEVVVEQPTEKEIKKNLTPVSAPKSPVAETVKKPAKKATFGKGEWVVQLGAFSQKTNADKLVKQLEAKGIPAYARPAKTAKGNMTKVFAGPTQRDEAIELKSQIQKILNVQGVVVKTG